MIAQLTLTTFLLAILFYAWTEYRRVPFVAVAVMFTGLLGLYFVWIPEHATYLAELAGVGRGVDLVLYVWVVISLLIFFNLHLKLRVQMELITKLAREIAIIKTRPESSCIP
jgi:small membrane protein